MLLDDGTVARSQPGMAARQDRPTVDNRELKAPEIAFVHASLQAANNQNDTYPGTDVRMKPRGKRGMPPLLGCNRSLD